MSTSIVNRDKRPRKRKVSITASSPAQITILERYLPQVCFLHIQDHTTAWCTIVLRPPNWHWPNYLISNNKTFICIPFLQNTIGSLLAAAIPSVLIFPLRQPRAEPLGIFCQLFDSEQWSDLHNVQCNWLHSWKAFLMENGWRIRWSIDLLFLTWGLHFVSWCCWWHFAVVFSADEAPMWHPLYGTRIALLVTRMNYSWFLLCTISTKINEWLFFLSYRKRGYWLTGDWWVF